MLNENDIWGLFSFWVSFGERWRLFIRPPLNHWSADMNCHDYLCPHRMSSPSIIFIYLGACAPYPPSHLATPCRVVLFSSSVASFLVWGGGTRPPNVPTEKKNHVHVTYMRERAPQKHIYFQVSKYICMHAYAINAVPFYYLWRYKWQYTGKTLTSRKCVNMRASEIFERA